MASCNGISRFILAIANLFLFIIGAALIVGGILTVYVPGTIVQSDLLTYSDDLRVIFDTTYLMIAAWVCVVLGVVVVIISLCGCLGSIFMSRVLLGIYIFVVIQILIVQIGVGLIIILSPEWFTKSVNDQLNTYIAQSPDPPFNGVNTTVETIGWNVIQYSVGCCGLNGSLTYVEAGATEDYYKSCCKVYDQSIAASLSLDIEREEGMKNYTYKDVDLCIMQIKDIQLETELKTEANDIGCIDKLYSSLMVYGIAVVAVVAVQIFIIILSFFVCFSAREEEKAI